MGDQQEGVVIGLREIYDKVTQTHEALQLMSPKMIDLEKKADTAMQIATEAKELSISNKKGLGWIQKAFVTVASGATLSFIGDLISKHIH
ncbi:hypothetical protein [Alicyclobacillus fastidiosus]|uniref:Hemolysin XhlA n=1 Tax=Alicyclobacillus fastidiosus TaxID=392011 RepID=A0ABV5AKN6_9BACL|nr:hypothetical protein [Alicyclobacillus fastidiosus]WEH08171.1 hypothetical protein PYS47_15810 [Alicyclobacillus fastidiosus]